MQKGVTISHRGSVYAIGRGPGYYGIWLAAGPAAQPVEWWPENPEGWQHAWARFTSIEAPGAIVSAADQPAPVTAAGPTTTQVPIGAGRRMIAPILLALGVAVGIAGLFFGYLGAPSLATEPAELVPHAIYLAAWGASAVLLLLGGSWPKVGALVGLGVSAVTFGLFAADFGTVLSAATIPAGTGLILSLLGWLSCAAGSIAALVVWHPGWAAKPRNREAWPAVALAAVTGLGAAITFAPSWDSYTLRTAAGVIASETAGNAFANPGLVIAGDVLVMALLVGVVIVAALWRPAALGAALVAGAIVPMAAQAISALVQVGEAVSPLQFGITPGQAARAGLEITSGLTPVFWVYCAFVLALILLCARMLTSLSPGPTAPIGAATLDAPSASVPVS